MLSPLDTIAANMPVASAQRKKQAQAATDFQLQQAVAAAPATQPVGKAAVQQLGAAAAQNVGQATVQAAQTGMGIGNNAAQIAIQQQQANLQQKLSDLQQGVNKQELAGEKELADLDLNVKKEIFDNRMQFERDRTGREYMNERQLQDYMIAHAESVEDFRNQAQQMEQASDMYIQAMETAYRKLSSKLEFESKKREQDKDQALIMELTKAKIAMEEKIADEKRKRDGRKAKFQAAGTIVGAVAGGVIGSAAGPGVGTAYGAMVGAQVGGTVGGMAADKTS